MAEQYVHAARRLRQKKIRVIPDPPPVISGPIYYVSTTGSDASGTGSQTSPWRTVKKACDTVTTGTISVGQGTFTETGTCTLRSGVSLVGSGQSNTIIRASSSSVTPLVLIQNTTAAQTVSDLQLDGRSRTTAFGLWVQGANGLTITRLNVLDFYTTENMRGGGINVASATDLTISYCTITNCGGSVAGTPYFNGALGIGNVLRANIHHNTISDQYGYTIKATSQGCFVTDSTFHNNVLTIPWIASKGPFSLCAELWETTALNSVWRNNTLDGPLSLTGSPTLNPPISSGYRWRIHNNHWTIGGSYGGGGYAVEMSTWSSEFDHNLVVGGHYPIGQFENKNVTDLYAHHNVFDNQISPLLLANLIGGCTDTVFTKNTVIARINPSIGVFNVEGSVTNSSITDSIFYSTASIGDKMGTGLGSFTINNNSFYRITTRGTNAISTDPGIPLTGSFPTNYTPTVHTTYGALADGPFTVGIE